jgi:hypothetical protein
MEKHGSFDDDHGFLDCSDLGAMSLAGGIGQSEHLDRQGLVVRTDASELLCQVFVIVPQRQAVASGFSVR